MDYNIKFVKIYVQNFQTCYVKKKIKIENWLIVLTKTESNSNLMGNLCTKKNTKDLNTRLIRFIHIRNQMIWVSNSFCKQPSLIDADDQTFRWLIIWVTVCRILPNYRKKREKRGEHSGERVGEIK